MNRTAGWLVSLLVGLIVFMLSCVGFTILNDILVEASPGDETTKSGTKVALSLILFAVFFLIAISLAFWSSRLVRSRLLKA